MVKQVKQQKSKSLSSGRKNRKVFAKSIDQHSESLNKIGQSLLTMFQNQKELARSTEMLDEQFAVLARLMFQAVNSILPDDKKLTYEQINLSFQEFTKFKALPDYKEHMSEWFMGADLTQLFAKAETPEAPVAAPAEAANG